MEWTANALAFHDAAVPEVGSEVGAKRVEQRDLTGLGPEEHQVAREVAKRADVSGA
jgi:hypothetical protein